MKLILGTVQFGLDYGINSQGRPSEDAVAAILRLAAGKGIRILDTSAAYGDSEKILGRVASRIGQVRFDIVSKYPKNEESVTDTFGKTLKNLYTDSIYGYLLHHFDVYRDTPEVWGEFKALKAKGRVSKIGFSLYSAEELELILERGDKFDLIQFPYNVFDRQFEPYLRRLKTQGVEIHVRSTFLQGLFFINVETLPGKLQPLRPYLEQLQDYAQHNGLTVAQAALNFNLLNPYIDGVLIGVDTESQLAENIEAISDQPVEISMNVIEKELLNPANWR